MYACGLSESSSISHDLHQSGAGTNNCPSHSFGFQSVKTAMENLRNFAMEKFLNIHKVTEKVIKL